MNSDSENPTDLSGLEMDLLKSLQPSWVKDDPSSVPDLRHFSDDRRDEREGGRGRDGFSSPRRSAKPRGDRAEGRSQRGDRREPARQGERRGAPRDRRDGPPRRDGGGPREREPREERLPMLAGWEVKFVPEPRGVEGLLKQIKSSAKAYGLFDLARLVLEKSPRYSVSFEHKDGPALFQCVEDGTLWLSQRDAVAHVLASHLDRFYSTEKITVEAPKGIYPVIAQCGMSGVFLGPPNHHDYQLQLRKVHAERFANVPFDIYKARIRMLRDEESIQKWKEQQTSRLVYRPLPALAPEPGAQASPVDVAAPADTPASPEVAAHDPVTAPVEVPPDLPEEGGGEPVAALPHLKDLAEVETHFMAHHASEAVIPAPGNFTVSGPAAVNDSAPAVLVFVRQELDRLIRFPLPITHGMSQQFVAGGLQIFKAHDNVTYVSVARPKALDRQATPVSESLAAILDYLESHAGQSRADQWKGLLSLPTLPAEESLKEPALLRDFHWLLLQGHVVDYATKGLELPKRGTPRPVKETPSAISSPASTSRGGEAGLGDADAPEPVHGN